MLVINRSTTPTTKSVLLGDLILDVVNVLNKSDDIYDIETIDNAISYIKQYASEQEENLFLFCVNLLTRDDRHIDFFIRRYITE